MLYEVFSLHRAHNNVLSGMMEGDLALRLKVAHCMKILKDEMPTQKNAGRERKRKHKTQTQAQ